MEMMIQLMNKTKYYKYLNLSFQFLFTILFFVVSGYLADNYFFKKIGIFTLTFPIIGFLISLYWVYKKESK